MGYDAGEYLVEFIQIGSSVKVSAIDPLSGREVSIVGPAGASRDQLTKVAIDKLRYVIAKKGS